MSTIVRKQAPAWTAAACVDEDNKTLSSADLAGKYYVLVFYPLDWTFVCPTELQQYSEWSDKFRAAGCEVLACSVDSVHSHIAWVQADKKKGGLGAVKIPLLADLTKSIARSFGVLVEDPADGDCGLSLRATFIVDGTGKVRHATINDNDVGRSAEETLRLVQAYQYVDKHGEVCPAGWTPGAKTMKADPKKSKEYFAAVHGA